MRRRLYVWGASTERDLKRQMATLGVVFGGVLLQMVALNSAGAAPAAPDKFSSCPPGGCKPTVAGSSSESNQDQSSPLSLQSTGP